MTLDVEPIKNVQRIRTHFANHIQVRLAVATGKNLGGDMLCLAAFFVEGNFAEVERLVIRNKIEYSFEKHLGKSARKNAVVANYILH